MYKSKLSPISLGLSFGILWGLSTLIMGLIATYYSYGRPFVAAMANLYPGYAATIKGSLIGGLYGFIDAFIFGLLLALLYNLFSCCCRKKDNLH
ncbi:bacteriophage holin [Legionella jordanis]|uniref:Transmembrane protein n=1 Tax=Legionella jordanis TaxID=456 RepID=A0A0W0VCK0_9GAMM|nr:bacteriophage holin [Legionella jordanis]KTD17843.1 hypothetical protein Ljor_2149 [Legionella jordanis]RMX02457.1 hypothetical protein EAW55_09420 [Legionella jordanis]RMX21700.1 hypothetical protein EAS68_02800 [Legionella jordanis]VEH11220.1 Uncharacterised protein [Legionella jordanis]HAT8713812.1 hypothetical protein [Legionella jordanis]